VAGERFHAAMLARQPLAAAGDPDPPRHTTCPSSLSLSGQGAPHMIVIEPENAHSQPTMMSPSPLRPGAPPADLYHGGPRVDSSAAHPDGKMTAP